MIRLQNIAVIRVTSDALEQRSIAARPLNCKAKWASESRVLSLVADLVDGTPDSSQFIAFMDSHEAAFSLELGSYVSQSSDEMNVSRFAQCVREIFEIRSGMARSSGALTLRYYLKARADYAA